MAATALLLPSLAAPTDTPRRAHRLLQPQLQLQRGSLVSRSLQPPRRRRLAVSAVQETKEGEAKTADEITEKYGLEFGLWKVSGGHNQAASEAHVMCELNEFVLRSAWLQVFSSKEEEGGEGKKSRTDQTKELLAKYGGAYLATSISLSIVSFTLCYLLVSAGVDVQDLLAKVSCCLPQASCAVQSPRQLCPRLTIQATYGMVLCALQVGIVTGETGGKVGTFALAYAAHKAASPIRFPPTVALTPVVASWIGKIRKGGD